MAKTDLESISELAAALDAILTELVEYRLLRPAPLRSVKLESKPTMSATERRNELFRRIAHDPFEGCLLLSLQALGEALYQQGGTKLMRNILQSVAQRDEENESRRLSSADSQWDGIGNETDRWNA
ncbi:MAG: hypothetical protein FJX39_09525 [Alphaproteobacteria bacterium]|nr:hypothetical protein [Alphaproteobacteria bacterium]